MAIQWLGNLIITAIMIPLAALILMLTTKIFKLADSSYKTAIKIAAIVGVIELIIQIVASYLSIGIALVMAGLNFILVSLFLALYLIKTLYDLEWGKTFLVWLVWIISYSLVTVILGGFILLIVVALGLSIIA